MPNRILREGILTSERVNNLSIEAENFYRRLISVVDDYARYYAKPELLRSACYPLKIDKVANCDIETWLSECESQGLIKCYQVDNTGYLELIDFKQQQRAKQSKFPCAADDKQVIEDDHLDEDEDEDDNAQTAFATFWDLYPRKLDKKKSKSAFLRLSKKKQQLAIDDLKTRFDNADPKFIPYPTTYLNGERWTDELPSTETPTKWT